MSEYTYEVAHVWEHGSIRVTLFEAHRWGEDKCRSYHRYILQSGDEILFEGDTFSPSPFRGDIGDAQVAELIGFLTLKPGDTDDEYFKDHTPRQLEWVESMEAETLSYMASDYEERGTWEYEDA